MTQALGLAAKAYSAFNTFNIASLRRRLANRPNGVPLKACTLGNSIFAGVSGVSFADQALQRGAGNVTWIANGGVASNTSAMMYARIGTAVPPDAQVCFFGEGPNDVALSSGQITAHRVNMELIIQWLLARGITPVLVMSSPYNSNADKIGAMYAVEQALALKYGIDVVDPWLDSVDTSTGVWAAGTNADAVHPNYAAAVSASTRLANWIAGSVPNTPFAPRSNAAALAPYCLSGGNNFNLTDTNSDGLADNWVAQGGNATASLTTAPAGFRGKFQRLTASGGGSGYSNLNRSLAFSGNVGDEILLSFALEAGNVSNTSGQVVAFSITNGPVAGQTAFTTIELPVTAQRMAIRFTKGFTGAIGFYMSVNSVGTGNYIGVGEFEAYNLTALLSG